MTVAVLDEPAEVDLHIDACDLSWRTFRGSGPGGQHRNKTDSAVETTHIPTGIVVKQEGSRSQHRNRALALIVLRARLLERRQQEKLKSTGKERKRQVGSGMRGDKRRTIRTQEGQVVDHVTGTRWRLRDYMRGEW